MSVYKFEMCISLSLMSISKYHMSINKSHMSINKSYMSISKSHKSMKAFSAVILLRTVVLSHLMAQA